MKVFVRLPDGPQAALSSAVRAWGAHPVAGSIPAPYREVGSVAEVHAAAADGAHLWLRGLEAAGPVPATTALILIRAAVQTGRPWVAEGLGPGASAAAVALGAAGVVLGPELWLATGTALPDTLRAQVAAARSGRDTRILGALQGQRARVLARGSVRAPVPQSLATARRHEGLAPATILDRIVAGIEAHQRSLSTTPLSSDPLGCGRPLVQGPMAHVSEGTELALAVAAAGGMPFAALSALEPSAARRVLRAWAQRVPSPWGVGVIGFDVMPHRDAHLDAIAALGERGPAAVTLAGGSVALARALMDRGLRPWLHTPSAALVEAALSAGLPAVILEGHEAGGHVGQLTSLGLWEEGLAVAAEHVRRGGAPPLVVLAGGIGDAISAALAAALAAPAAALGVQIALQLGTALLLTHEIVEAGQITGLYQAQALSVSETVLVGSSVNLPLRCPQGPFAREARATEQRLIDEGLPLPRRRAQLEATNLGRTRLAAKGIERSPGWEPGSDAPRYRPASAEDQLQHGAFTLGQGAVLAQSLQTVPELFGALTDGAHALLQRHTPPADRWGPPGEVSGLPASSLARIATGASAAPAAAPVAVVGLGCVLPDALDLPTFWRNLIEGHDAVGPVDEDRWGRASYLSSGDDRPPGRTHARHAGAVRGFTFDPLPFRIPPRVLPTVDPSQRLALAASAEAVRRAGWDTDRRPDPARAAVVLGNAMGGPFAKDLSLRIRFREVIDALARDELAAGWRVEDLQALEARIEDRLAEQLPPLQIDSMAGLLSNVVAGRVAAWLDWMGGNLTVDAACAASLAAITVAVDWLRTGRCDAVLAGGVDTDLTAESYVGFTLTHALSATGSSPFSRDADGFVMGEGAAVLALKRLDDAVRDGDPVWAVIRGVGQSSDGRGRGITAPRAEGQALALQRAWQESGLDPAQLGLIEAHGTGTALGDRTEVQTLVSALHGGVQPVWLGSVKSMIGHLKGAAGAAGLTKAVLAVRTGIVPPTLHAGPPSPELGLQRSVLRLPRTPVRLPEERRVAGVSAFGFGGTNFHLVLGPAPTGSSVPDEVDAMIAAGAPLAQPAAIAAWGPDDASRLLIAYGAATREDLVQRLVEDRPLALDAVSARPHRLVLLTTTGQRSSARSAAARWLQADPGAPAPPGVHLGQGPAPQLLLMFPGQGSQRLGAIDSLSRLPQGARALAELEALLSEHSGDRRTLRQRERRHDVASDDPQDLHATLFALGLGWARVLEAAALPIAATLGHSLGAYAALVAAGWWSAAAAAAAVVVRGKALIACPPGGMLAVRCDPQQAAAIAREHGLVVAAENAPQSSVLSGPVAAVRDAARALGPSQARLLDVERAYHSPVVAPAAGAVEAVITADPPRPGPIPVFSARTGAHIVDPVQDLVRGIVEPVRFAACVRALAAPDRLFVEVGPGSTLTNLARRAGASALSLDPTPDDRGQGLLNAAAGLLARGLPQLARALPGTLVMQALPAARARPTAAPAPAPQPAPPPQPTPRDPVVSSSPPDRRRAAGAVQDLRIAAIADPSLQPAYLEARRALLGALAGDDRALVGAPQASAQHPPPPAQHGGSPLLAARAGASPAPAQHGGTLQGPERHAGATQDTTQHAAPWVPAPHGGSSLPAPQHVGATQNTAQHVNTTQLVAQHAGAPQPPAQAGTPQGAAGAPLHLGTTHATRPATEPLAGSWASSGPAVGSSAQGSPAASTQPQGTPRPPARSSLREQVIEAICEITGYSAEHIGDDADLEADLGIDSIRKMEILALLERRLGFTTAESDYVDLASADLQTLVHHVEARLARGEPADPHGGQATVPTGAQLSVPALRGLPRPPRPDQPPPVALHIERGADPLEVVQALLQQPPAPGPAPLIAVLPEGDPAGAAAAGFLRTLAREQRRPLRLIWLRGPIEADTLERHLSAPAPAPELVLTPHGAATLSHMPLEPDDGGPDLSDSVWLVCGGAGIVLPCLQALRALQIRVALLGRRSAEEAAPLLEQLRASGFEASYHPCDASDAAAVEAAVDGARRRWGRIDVVLHAAGVLADAPVLAATPAELEQIWHPKVGGAQHLVDATAQDAPLLWCSFSSLVAHLGNPGQALYGAANAALERISHPTARRSLALAWTAWREVGMAADPALQRLLASRGVHALGPAAGAEAFRRLVQGTTEGTVLITAQPLPQARPPAWPLVGARTWSPARATLQLTLDPRAPALADHQLGGRPLVPAAVWVSALIEAAALVHGPSETWCVEDLEIHAPTFVDRIRDDIVIALTPAPDASGGAGLTARVEADGTVVCSACLRVGPPPADTEPPRPLHNAAPADGLYRPDLLFHGPTWRVLSTIQTQGDRLAQADLIPAEGIAPVAGAIDGAHQLLCALGHQPRADGGTGWLGLPTGADRWIYNTCAAPGPLRLITEATEANDQELRADVTGVDARGRVALRGEGVRLRAAARGPGSGPRG